MAACNLPATDGPGQFNTLAQSGTAGRTKKAILLKGKGSELANPTQIKGRAKRKLITRKLALSLVDAAGRNGNPERIKSYWNSYHCYEKIYTTNGRVYGRFCKNRHCTVCSAIRKADIINRYLPVLRTWPEPYFVTLTVKAHGRVNIRVLMKGIIKAFRQICGKYRKRKQRGKGLPLIGIKSLECNYNPVTHTYNPHLHLIVANRQMAEILVNEWLQKWTPKFTHKAGQHKRAVIDRERDLIEIVKYGSKIFTEPDVNRKAKQTGQKIYVAALDNIFQAMKGIRIFERFGFNLPPVNPESGQMLAVNNYDEWVFDTSRFDWCNTTGYGKLSNFYPLPELLELLENRIDTTGE